MVCGLVPLGYLWAECLYRYQLYLRYGSEPYANHVGDGYSFLMLGLALGTAGTLLVAAAMTWASKMKIPAIICFAGAFLAVTNAVVIRKMRASKVLVTYSEFVRNMGP